MATIEEISEMIKEDWEIMKNNLNILTISNEQQKEQISQWIFKFDTSVKNY